MPYSKLAIQDNDSMSNPQPGLFVFLLDASGSMERPVQIVDKETLDRARDLNVIPATATTLTRAQMLSIIVNEAFEAILAEMKAKATGVIKDRAKITVFQFGSSCIEVSCTMGLPMTRLWPQKVQDLGQVKKTIKSRGGESYPVECLWWIDPLPTNQAISSATSYFHALEAAKKEVDDFIQERSGQSFYPPQVILITDGQDSEGPQKTWHGVAKELSEKAVLWIIHLGDGKPLAAADPRQLNIQSPEEETEIYDHSSFMPDPFVKANQASEAFDVKISTPACSLINTTPLTLRYMLRLIKTGTLTKVGAS